MSDATSPTHGLKPARLTRRRLLAGVGATLTAFTLPARPRAEETAGDGYRVLRIRPGEARLRGINEQPTAIWGYDGVVPGPTLRVKQGEVLKIRVVNGLRQSTVVHWHGLRLPNAMDGVPHLTQMPIEAGASFDYHYAPPDAGTFWYHSHFLSSEQVERGLYGVLVVDEREPVAVDRDLVVALDDWRLTNDGAIAPGFGNVHDAAMAGRLGQYITLNSADVLDVPVRTNERVRLRIVNCANARIFRLRIGQHAARVMATDGQPCPPFLAPGGVLRLAPGNRIDLFLDATLAPGSRAPILVDDLRGGEIEIGRIVYDAGPPLRAAPLAEPKPLADNPLPTKLDFAAAFNFDMPLDGGGMVMMMRESGMMGQGRRGQDFRGHGDPPLGRIWAQAGLSSTGHDGPPLFSVARGRTVVVNLPNRTMFPHAMHVHGHHFRQLERSGNDFRQSWLDTVIVDPNRAERIAFIADNPGKWMVHCHMLEHQESGMAGWFEVT